MLEGFSDCLSYSDACSCTDHLPIDRKGRRDSKVPKLRQNGKHGTALVEHRHSLFGRQPMGGGGRSALRGQNYLIVGPDRGAAGGHRDRQSRPRINQSEGACRRERSARSALLVVVQVLFAPYPPLRSLRPSSIFTSQSFLLPPASRLLIPRLSDIDSSVPPIFLV